jgi:putative OPT family oligopeptide transporter
MHGKYPFPEATATTQVLVSGEKGGSQAKPLLIAGLIGGLYDFAVSTFGAWQDTLTTRMIPWGAEIANKIKMEFSIYTGSAVLGLGYIIGLKYSMIICSGSLFIWFVIVPLLGSISPDLAAATPAQIFTDYGRSIGVGAIAMAGIIGIIKSWGVIKGAVGLAKKELGGKGKAVAEALPRTERDLSMKLVLISIVAALIIVFVFFYFGVIHSFMQTVVAFLVVAIIAFLFTTVAANAIAIVGSNPVSGMTLMTLIVASVILVSVGLKGTSGMVASMVIGGVVCTALSMAGGFITDLKIGYWIGVTPAKQETWKFLGTLVSAATVGGVMIILNKTYGFTGEGALVAPQANAMAAVIEPLMMGQGAPWMLYGCGAILALLLNVLGVPVLPFALGMFIPLQLNTPLVVGGLISWYVSTRSKDAELNNARMERGTLLASGFIAGGALMGVVSAIMKFAGADFFMSEWYGSNGAAVVGLVMYIAIIAYLTIATMKAKKA